MMTCSNLRLRWALPVLVAIAACGGNDIEDLGPVPAVEPAQAPPPGRDAARVTVDQLERSVAVITGNTTWIYELDGQAYDLFFYLGATLGRPDYITVTDEPAVPDALYVKFMTDMALNICKQMAAGDAEELTRFAPLGSADDAAITENLQYLHLRLYGERVHADDEGLLDLRGVYDAAQQASSTTASSGARQAWQAVCVAMVSAPAFHLY
jgi:hypothetical protein